MTPQAVERLVRQSSERDGEEPPVTGNPFDGFLDGELDVMWRALRDYRDLTEDETCARLLAWCGSERFVRVASC